MIVVTGASGFIGSNLISGLNSLGITNILAVDDLTNGRKVINLRNLKILLTEGFKLLRTLGFLFVWDQEGNF